VQTVGPYDTHPDALAIENRQRYYEPPELGFNSIAIGVVFPAVIAGRRINLQHFKTGTIYLTVSAGAGSSVRVDMGMYDTDDTTLLVTALVTVGAVGAVTSIDIGEGGGGTLRGRVFRVHDFRLSRTAAGGVDPVVELRAWFRS
jgi:hypothetical protein